MSEPDPMSAAINDALRKGGSLAVLTAALITLMVRMLREQRRQDGLQRQAQPAQHAASAPPPAADRIRSMYDQVFTHLPEPMARALTTSAQFPVLVDALTELQARDGDVAAFLTAVGPVLAREQARTSTASAAAASTAPTPSPPAPADRPGLRERARNAWAAFTARDAAPAVSTGLSPADEAWAVITAAYACGIDGARRLAQSPGWPRLAQDIVTLGYARQHGLTDLEPARILEDAYRAMPASLGLDWPAAASAAFARARNQFRNAAPASAPAMQPAMQPAADRAHAARTTSPPTTAPAQPDGTTAPSRTQSDLAPRFEDGTHVPNARAQAAARSDGVALDVRMHVVDHADAPQQPSATGSVRGQRQGR